MNKKELEFKKGLELIQRRKKRVVIIILSLLIIIAGYYYFFGDLGITGKATKDINNKIQISAELLTIPNLNLNSEFKEIKLSGKSDSEFIAGGNKFDFKNSDNINIILENFDGEINIKTKSISKLNGKASRVLINNIPITQQSGEKIDISLKDNFIYDNIEIKEVLIDELSYKTSGLITLNNDETKINLNNDDIKILNFFGSLKINKNIILNGHTRILDISGKNSEIKVVK